MKVFYAGALLTITLNVTMLRIDSGSISVITKRASVQSDCSRCFLSTWFKVEGQVVECWNTRSANAGNAEW